MSELERRVSQLERRVRWHRNCAVAALLSLAAVVSVAARDSVPEVIRAHRFEALNADGRPAIVLKVAEWGGLVQTVGNDGVSGVSLGASSTGGFVGVRDDRPTLFPRVELSTDGAGGLLAVRSWNGFAVEIDRDGLSVAHTQEDPGFTRVDPRLVLSAGAQGGQVRLINATGDTALTLDADANGAGRLLFRMADGEQRPVLP